ncbi:hypothetical protein CFR71_08080 [Novacetimonas pomaceti]|uniref:Uncharacterized protein n=2 Tax=Novacetimonas pomaceti TaxID=2021998 RepID=A0A318QKD0_9PROT|nr:hypothetical protein CFR71_08080 [Novacetimonas pomaceti]
MHVPVASADMSTVVINPSSVILGKVLSRPSRAGGAFVENIDGSVSSGPLSIGGAGAVALGRAHDPPGDISVTSVMAEKAAGACLMAAGWICAIGRGAGYARYPDSLTSGRRAPITITHHGASASVLQALRIFMPLTRACI